MPGQTECQIRVLSLIIKKSWALWFLEHWTLLNFNITCFVIYKLFLRFSDAFWCNAIAITYRALWISQMPVNIAGRRCRLRHLSAASQQLQVHMTHVRQPSALTVAVGGETSQMRYLILAGLGWQWHLFTALSGVSFTEPETRCVFGMEAHGRSPLVSHDKGWQVCSSQLRWASDNTRCFGCLLCSSWNRSLESHYWKDRAMIFFGIGL